MHNSPAVILNSNVVGLILFQAYCCVVGIANLKCRLTLGSSDPAASSVRAASTEQMLAQQRYSRPDLQPPSPLRSVGSGVDGGSDSGSKEWIRPVRDMEAVTGRQTTPKILIPILETLKSPLKIPTLQQGD